MPLLPEQVPPSDHSLVQSAGEIAILLHASKYDQAFPKLQQILKEHPTTPFLHYAYGLALASLSQYDEAEAQLREESRISPQSDLPYVLLASIALRKHDPAAALASAELAVQLAPESAKAHYILGRASLESGQVEKAIHELEAANKINPGSPEVHFNLAKAYARAKQPEKAEEERAIFAHLNALAEHQRTRHQPILRRRNELDGPIARRYTAPKTGHSREPMRALVDEVAQPFLAVCALLSAVDAQHIPSDAGFQLAKRSAARALAFAASSSRFLGGAVVSSERRRRLEMAAISSMAAWKACSFALEGLLKPVIFLTNWSEAARTSSSVTGGSKLKRVLIFLHMAISSLFVEVQTHAAPDRRGKA